MNTNSGVCSICKKHVGDRMLVIGPRDDPDDKAFIWVCESCEKAVKWMIDLQNDPMRWKQIAGGKDNAE